MYEINIISSDLRYEALNEIFLDNGYTSRLCDNESVNYPDALVLPIKSALNDEDYSKIFHRIKKGTLVFCANENLISKFPDVNLICYTNDENFLDKNAYITAECAVMLAMSEGKKTLNESKCAIIGYGRIGRHLSKILLSLGSDVVVFARRSQSRDQARENGCRTAQTFEFQNEDFDVIFNTVPEKIISKDISAKISSKTLVYDLASLPGGFEDEKFPKRALGLPGKIMPISAGKAIFDFVNSYILSERN